MARIPPSLGRRSGYELRVIGYLDEKWPFPAEDRLAAAAHGLDVFKKKHRDDWQWLLEANAHPDAASETIVRTILEENSRLYRMAYDYDRRTAAKVPVSQRSPLEQAIYWAEAGKKWLLGGSPDGCLENLRKAAAIIERDPELKRIPGLQAKLRGCVQALGSYDPRSADRLVDGVVSLLKARLGGG